MVQLAMIRMASSSPTFKAHVQTARPAFRSLKGQISWLHELPLTMVILNGLVDQGFRRISIRSASYTTGW